MSETKGDKPIFQQLSFWDEQNCETNRREVRQISHAQAKPFILNIHYARRLPCIQYAYGLFIGDTLVGVVTYGQPASRNLCMGIAGKQNIGRVIELNRLVICDNTKNNASFLVGRSLKLLPKGMIVVSYADNEGWGHVGYVYQATNWLYTGRTKSRTDAFAGEGKHSRHSVKGETRREYRTAKYRYVYITGKGKERKQLLEQLQYPTIKEYPKGESRHYNTSNPVPLVSGGEIKERDAEKTSNDTDN